MVRDWRKRVAEDPRVIEIERRLADRRRGLAADKEFVLKTEKLRKALEELLATQPKRLSWFFRSFSYPIGSRLTQAIDFINTPPRTRFKVRLKEYLAFVSRFGVVFRLRKKTPRFTLEYLIPWGFKFHVRLIDGHFEPAQAYPGGDVPFDYFFESESVEVWPALEKQIKSRKAKLVQIDDCKLTSVLTRLEDFAYHADGLTFIFHNAEQPYLFCLVGEKVSTEIWRDASTIVSAFLRKHFNRGKAGRRKNVPRLRRTIALRNQPGMLKEKIPLKEGREKDFLSEQAYLARVGRSLR